MVAPQLRCGTAQTFALPTAFGFGKPSLVDIIQKNLEPIRDYVLRWYPLILSK